jgi:hypothetical protein
MVLSNAPSLEISRPTRTVRVQREGIRARNMVVFRVNAMPEYPLISTLLVLTDIKVNRTTCSPNERRNPLSILLRRLATVLRLLLMKKTVPTNLGWCFGLDDESKPLGESPVL